MDLLDEVVAELENARRPMRFSFIPIAGLAAAATIVIALLALNLWPAASRPVGTEESARATTSFPVTSPSPTLPPGVVPIRANPPLSEVPTFDADIAEWNVAVTGSPVLAAHGSIWYGDSRTGQLTRVDAATGEVSGVIDVNPNPQTDRWDQIASADDRWVFAAGLDETIVQIDPSTNEIVQRIPIGTLPYRMELRDGNAYITDLDLAHVTRVDLSVGEVVWTVRVGVSPGGIEVTDEAVWVASYGDARLHRLDPETGELLATYPAYLYGMEILYDGEDALYITGNQGRPLERFSISEGRVTARAEEMGAVLYEGRLYGLSGEGHLIVLDAETLQWLAVTEVAAGAPEGGVVTGEGGIWISSGERLFRVQPNL
jgi:outer membrane protein assembly factor BamB